jgi:hypothetical protein
MPAGAYRNNDNPITASILPEMYPMVDEFVGSFRNIP